MKIYFLFALLPVFAACNHSNKIVHEFRGPDRSGIYAETDLMRAWPETGPEEVFYIDGIGPGYGSPTIVNDLLYVTGTVDSTAMLYCYSLDGSFQWQLKLGSEWVKNYPGSRCTPTVTGDLLYAGTGKGDLICVDRKNVTIQWTLKLDELGGVLPLFGHSEAPLVDGSKIFWTVGGPVNNVVAMNRFTGELIWSCMGEKERSAYHPPRVIRLPTGRKVLVTFSAYHMLGIDAASGELLWSHLQDNYPPEQRKPGYGDTHANTVVYDNGFVYYVEGDGNCAVKLAISPDGDSIQEIWRNKRFDSFMGGIVKIGHYLYGCGTASNDLRSLDCLTGAVKDSVKLGPGVVISADSLLYYYAQTGNMYLVHFKDGIMNPVSSFRVTKGSGQQFSHPVIYQGVLYIRRGNAIMGYKI